MSNPHPTDKDFDRISKGVELCMSCGFCCNGVLLVSTILETDEAELVTQPGLNFYQKKGEYVGFYQPCPCLKDSKCSVYAQRPRACRNYQCELLKEHLQGTISFKEAVELVRKAISLMEAIYRHIGGVAPSKRIWEQIRDFMELQARSVNSEESRCLIARLLLDVKELSIICSSHFDDEYFR